MKDNVLILDLGGVVFDIETSQFENWIRSKTTERTPSDLKEKVDAWYLDYERGDFDRQGYFQRLRDEAFLEFEDKDFIEAWCSIWKGDVEGMAELMEEVKSRMPLYALSNSNDIHTEVCFPTKPQLDLFEKMFLSHVLKMSKPDVAIFQYVQEDLGLKPENIFYFDDRVDNVEAACHSGWKAYVFENAEQVEKIVFNKEI